MLPVSITMLAFALAATSVMEVPDPRPTHHVVDLTGTLTAADIEAIDEAAAAAAAGGELLVVVVPSTDGADARQWTTAYFNRLRLDSEERNRGVVLMAAIKDRKSEIVVGEGYPGAITTVTDRIMQGVIVAHFKAGDPRGALVEGARAIQDRVIARAPPAPPLPEVALPKPVEVPASVIAASIAPAVMKVPDPRTVDGAVDPMHSLNKAEQAEVDLLRREASKKGSELAVVLLKGTGTLDARDFARGLFHRLQLDPERKRGVLLFVVGQRVEVVAGDGFPPEFIDEHINNLADTWRAAVRKQPTKGARAAATLAAARTLSQLGGEVDAQVAAQVAKSEAEAARVAQAERLREQADASEPSYAPARERASEGLPPFLFPLGGFVGLVGGGLGLREILRRRPRSCKKCNVAMHRLAEELDDEHLEAGERSEERLGSVDYDLWACAICGTVMKTRWGAIFSRFSKCTGCRWKTMSSSSVTISAATTSSTGLARVTKDCQHCSYHRSYTRVIPRVRQTTSSSSRGGGGGGFSSGRGSSGSW